MKKLAVLTAILLATCSFAHSQLTLGPGETYTYEFETLSPTERYEIGFPPVAAMSVTIYGFQSGDALRIEMFEDDPMGAPFCERTVTNTTNPLHFSCSELYHWQDLQGSIRLTMVSGSATIDNFLLHSFRPSGGSSIREYAARVYVPEGRPLLQVVPSERSIVLRWETSATNFVLEATPSMSAVSQWEAVTNTVEVTNGTSSVTIARDQQVQAEFYRLRRLP